MSRRRRLAAVCPTRNKVITMAEEGNTKSGEIMLHCAGCGVKEGDDIKLMKCTACYLVRYCGVKCQKEHRSKHKKECKKRAAELRDEILFKQPESSYLGDCPICCLPLSIDPEQFGTMSCCVQTICVGCNYANQKREIELRLESTCPFCRHPMAVSEEETKICLMKRVKANDPVAMTQIGCYYGNRGDYKSAFEYWTKAVKLGDMDAHYNLSIMYLVGQGVEMDEKKRVYHLEEAAIGGHAEARYYLGNFEATYGRPNRAIKHWIIAANQGHDESLEALKKNYEIGIVSKEEFAAALRAHKAAVDATRSPQREEAICKVVPGIKF